MLLDLTDEPQHKVDVSAILARYNSGKTIRSMDPNDFHRRQRQQRERDLVAARNAKHAARSYRMSLRALDVAPLLKLRDVELNRRRHVKKNKERAERFSPVSSLQDMSPSTKSSGSNIMKRVKSFRGGSSRPKMSTGNPMFESNRSNGDEYVVSTPFVLPLNVQPPARARPVFKPGNLIQSDMKRIIADALAEKAEMERELLGKDEHEDDVSDKSSVTVEEEEQEEQDQEQEGEQQDEEQPGTPQAAGGAMGFITGLLAKKEPVQASEVPAQRVWPAWMGKLGGTKNTGDAPGTTTDVADAVDLEVVDTEEVVAEQGKLGKWFGGLMAPTKAQSNNEATATTAQDESSAGQQTGWGAWVSSLGGKKNAGEVVPATDTTEDL